MKRGYIFLMIIFVFINMFGFVGEASNATTISCKVIVSSRNVILGGNISSGANQEISLSIVDPNGKWVYAHQIISGEDGDFLFVLRLGSSATFGTYTVTVGGSGVTVPQKTSFEYEPDDVTDPLIPNLTAEILVLNSIVTISGNISSGANKEISLNITDPNGKWVYAHQVTSGEGGAFFSKLKLGSSAVSGTYNVTVGGSDVLNPLKTSFVYGIDEDVEPEGPYVDVAAQSTDESVNVYGNTNFEEGNIIDIDLLDVYDNKVISTVRCVTNSDGKFNAQLVLRYSLMTGVYSVRARSVDFDCSDRVYIKYIAPIKDIQVDEKINPNLYNALKIARPSLDGDNNGIITVMELENIVGYLDLSNRNISNITELQHCKNITGLNVSNNDIKSIESVAHMTNLKTLVADNNFIGDIPVLPSGLTMLNVENNKLNHLSCLVFVDGLYALYAGNNNMDFSLKAVNYFENQTELRYLDLSDNHYEDISNIKNLTNLIFLDLSDNYYIEDVSPLKDMIHLKHLNLSGNRISDISTLPNILYHNLILDGNLLNSEDILSFTIVNK